MERLEHFFSANGVDDADKKRSVLLTVIGAATYKTLRNILSPEKPGEKPYAELVESLSKYFKPTPSEIVERFKFHSRVRKAGESISTYVAQLKLLTPDFYIMHSKLKTQFIVYAAQGYSAPVLKAEHLVSCLCVRVRVCGGGCLFVGGGCGLWVFSYAIHMYIRGKD